MPFEPPMVPSPSQVTPSTSAPPKKRCPRASKSAPTLQPIGIPDQASSSAPKPIKRSTLNIVWEGRRTVKDARPTQMYSVLPASWVGNTHEETDFLPISNREEKRSDI